MPEMSCGEMGWPWYYLERIAGVTMLALTATAQPLTPGDVARIAPYAQYWGLEREPAAERDRLNDGLRQARAEFGGRGAALARHFLIHIQARPSNTAYFFLFRAVGDVDTAMVLIPALTNPPVAQGSVLGRDPAEIQIALEAALANEPVRTSGRVVAALEEVVRAARARPGYIRHATTGISVLGKCRTSEAVRFLQAMAGDANPEIRAAALGALPPSDAAAARAVTADQNPQVRAQAAETLGHGEPAQSTGLLRASLEREKDPKVIDQTVRALTTLRALPHEPAACLQMAARCWEPSVAKPLFDCWRAAASPDDLLAQATSASWTVRALALEAAAETVPLDGAARDRLLQSAAELLSHDLSGLPAPDTLSYAAAQLARNALWEISGKNMTVALRFADRIVPLSGHYASAGRFGESYDLAAKDPRAYATLRRGPQLLEAGLAGLLMCILLAIRRMRRMALALLIAAGVWGAFTLLESDVRELPPPPLGYLTVTCLSLLSGGLAAGWMASTRLRGWQKVVGATVLGGIIALLVCGWTRSAGWFPIGSEGWDLIFDPIGAALLAGPFAFVLSLILLRWSVAPASRGATEPAPE